MLRTISRTTKSQSRKSISVLFASIATSLMICSLLSAPHSASAYFSSTYTQAAKPMEFYFHDIDTPVNVAGLQTKYIMNTTRAFKFTTQESAYSASFYKPTGQPKIDVDFYLFPNFAGPVTVDGQWQVFLWINASAYKPTGFSLVFQEITVGGNVLWDSGNLSPTITSSVGGYVDVPIYNYNLTVTLTHSFAAGTTLHVQAEVNTGSSADTRIWYDSPLYPSKAILPARDYARPSSVKTYAYDNSETELFYYNWSDSQRIVIVRANVTDPFGGYDVFKVNSTILDPTGHAVVENMDMQRVTDGQWVVSYSNVNELNWTYPTNATLGNYTATVTVIDNNGYYSNIDTDSYGLFTEEYSREFTIGIVTYYDPSFLITDDLGNPLPDAQVYIAWPNGTIDTIPRYTSNKGFINLTGIAATSNVGFTILWKDILVQQTSVQINSNGPYTIKTHVYQLTVQVQDHNGANVDGAYVIVYSQSGVGYGLDTTNATGQAVFDLPAATYRIDVRYVADYWLTVVKTNASDTVQVASSSTKIMILDDFPPTIWSTIGFLLVLAAIVFVVVAVALYVVFRRRMKLPPVHTS